MEEIKEVLVITPFGQVLTTATENDNIRHDILVGKLIKSVYDNNYQIKDSMLDNSEVMATEYGCLVILPDVSDMVVIFPETIFASQARYYLDNFADASHNIRVHIMQISDQKYKDISEEKMLKKLENICNIQSRGR